MPEFDIAITDFERGYRAAQAGLAHWRFERWWIDTPGQHELCWPAVVAGIEAYYRDVDAADLRDTQRCAQP